MCVVVRVLLRAHSYRSTVLTVSLKAKPPTPPKKKQQQQKARKAVRYTENCMVECMYRVIICKVFRNF